jgi:hypothetical protein
MSLVLIFLRQLRRGADEIPALLGSCVKVDLLGYAASADVRLSASTAASSWRASCGPALGGDSALRSTAVAQMRSRRFSAARLRV